jgi:hypothetical protein
MLVNKKKEIDPNPWFWLTSQKSKSLYSDFQDYFYFCLDLGDSRNSERFVYRNKKYLFGFYHKPKLNYKSSIVVMEKNVLY